ncbi:DNA-binding protein [Oceanidesulfovibrio indonesiensis]|uniref:DNA-binding protein n=1 Tax=Oceanidesulfovibrio indonesiensis TaxID=54767 RepID=A0A7M3M9T4_9BACT|nr:helix-turn-helix domain-containing protein [Oceanidesulfovibrio indonesiensis]TVM13536.1 DNA-binding protein [Oceanidesulfovibrio indonesiensis]
MNDKRYLRTKEAATYIGISASVLNKDRVTKLIGIPFTRVGRTILYDREVLDAWLKAQGESSSEDPATGRRSK